MTAQSQMTPEQRLQYAAHLIRGLAAEYDYLGIFEAFEAYPEVPGDELSEEDGRAVADLMASARVIVLFPGQEKNVENLLDIVGKQLRKVASSPPINEVSEPSLGSTVRVNAGANRGHTYERKPHETLPGCDGEVWWVEHRFAWATWAQVQRLVGDDPWELVT